jgi:broad specificity phosphatase PhoE
MSELILVRHGQASFGSDSYDKLSERGIEQVRLLAEHWHATGERFDHIYSGNLLRQKETASELLMLGRVAPLQLVETPHLNEYNGDPLIQLYLRDHAANDGVEPVPMFPIKEERLFQKLFESATSRWIKNELQPTAHDTAFEYWLNFQSRVYGVLDELMAKHNNGARVLISTSGGVIAMALQRVLQFPDEQVITTNWMVHNSSVTRIKYGNGKMSLTQFNNLAHLERSGLQHMITYR